MNTKLTLTIDKSVIEKAKRYAKNSGRSLSDLIQAYLERLVLGEGEAEAVPEAFRDLFGSVNLPAEMDDKASIRALMAKKHQA